MNISELVKQLRQEIKQKEDVIEALHRLAERIPEDRRVSLGYGTIDFDEPPREDVPKLMQAIAGGRWEKELTGSDEKVNYITSGFHPTVKVRIWGAPPPPNCKIVEFEEQVPAQPATVRKVRKLVCIDHQPKTQTAS